MTNAAVIIIVRLEASASLLAEPIYYAYDVCSRIYEMRILSCAVNDSFLLQIGAVKCHGTGGV